MSKCQQHMSSLLHLVALNKDDGDLILRLSNNSTKQSSFSVCSTTRMHELSDLLPGKMKDPARTLCITSDSAALLFGSVFFLFKTENNTSRTQAYQREGIIYVKSVNKSLSRLDDVCHLWPSAVWSVAIDVVLVDWCLFTSLLFLVSRMLSVL